jgi:hypothetical protein
MDKSRKLMNPENFDEDGNIKKDTKKFKKKWNLSHTYRLDRNKLRTLYRKKSAYIKQSHEMLANRILDLGGRVFVEDMNFKALQKKAKKTERSDKVSTIIDKNGNEKQVRKYKKKKRFGKSINNKAPAMAISIIDRKLHYHHSEIHKVNTRTFKASQYNHITNEYNPKGLTVRGQIILPDTWNSNDDLQTTNRDKCFNTFNNFLTLHNKCIEQIKRTIKHRPKSFGF